MEHETGNKQEKKGPLYAGIGLVFGAALGTVFGLIMFGEIAMSIGVGAAIGLLIGAGIDAQTGNNLA